MANPAMGDKEPTFNLPTGGSSDLYLAREVNNSEDDNNGKVLKKKGLLEYPFLTRRTGDSLVGTNEEIQSNELRHGRTASKTKIGNASSSGSQDIEFSPETFDDQMEGAFRSHWIRWTHDGAKDSITKKYLTPDGYIHVNGEDGTYNQYYDEAEDKGKGVSTVPLLYTGNETGSKSDPFGLIKVSPEKLGARSVNPTGKFIVHELHVGEDPVKYSYISRIPINDEIVRYQQFRHVEVGEINLNVTVNAIVTGSLTLSGSNNPSYYTEVNETGKKRMAEKMTEDKAVAKGEGDEFFSTDYEDAAERFIAAVKNTTESTETDQFTALEGFLYVNGHQIQFASDLTMDLNNNLTPVNAIFVKNAIANISPSLDVTGNITAYFTDGEMDSTGKKFGADDLKNLASENKDVEILYAFQDKEDPEVVYIFQIFKATLSAPTEDKGAENPITLDLPYNSFGEMAVRCLRIVLPKVRKIEFGVEEYLAKDTPDGKISVRLVPNVPLETNASAATENVYSDYDYIDTDNTNGSYVFHDAEVYLNAEELDEDDFEFSGVTLLPDGSIGATLEVPELKKGDTIQLKVVVNGSPCEKAVTVTPEIPYLRMGKNYASATLESGKLVLSQETTLNVFSAKTEGEDKEDYLIYLPSGNIVPATDLVVESSDSNVVSVEGGVLTASADEGAEALITVSSKEDSSVKMVFKVLIGEPLPEPQTPVLSGLEDVEAEDEQEVTLAVTASVTDDGVLSYAWDHDGTPVGTNSPTFTIPSFNAETDEGTYTVTVTNTLNGKTKTATASATVSSV